MFLVDASLTEVVVTLFPAPQPLTGLLFVFTSGRRTNLAAIALIAGLAVHSRVGVFTRRRLAVDAGHY